MKKIIILFTILAAAIITTSCQKELPDAINKIDVNQGGKTPTPTPTPELKVSEPKLFSAKGGQQTITITATEGWTLSKSSGSDWLSVNTMSGKAGTTQVELVATENTQTKLRTATITVSSGDLTKVVELSQSAANSEISLSVDNLSFTSDGGNQSFSIKSNISWTVTSSQDWCSVSQKSGSGNGNVSVSVEGNTSISERSAMITIESEAGNQIVKVIQSGADPVLSLSVDNLDFTSGIGSKSFSITSNTSWTVTSSQGWCSVSPTSGSSNGNVSVSVDENTSILERTATITIRSEAGNLTIKVTQIGANPELELNKYDLSFTAARGNDTFTITSNTSWLVTSNQDWCVLSSTSGSNNATVTVNVSENTSPDSRTATITVKADNLQQNIKVTQSGADVIDESTRTFAVNGVTFKMVRVDGGTFTMGGTWEQGDDAWEDELPTHRVTLSTYYMGDTEVTQELWQAVMGNNPSYFSGGQRPVERVSWYDCQDFIDKLNTLTGRNFRLPTEAEWEFAARGGNKSQGYKYAGSNNIDNIAWYYENSAEMTHNVAQKSPNELGLYDMSGNVWEWCQDWYGSYSSSGQTNPTGPSSGTKRVHRGGSISLYPRGCRISYRADNPPSSTYTNLGFRLAL